MVMTMSRDVGEMRKEVQRRPGGRSARVRAAVLLHEERVERLQHVGDQEVAERVRDVVEKERRRLLHVVEDALNAGEIRAAEPDASAKTGWRVNSCTPSGTTGRAPEGSPSPPR